MHVTDIALSELRLAPDCSQLQEQAMDVAMAHVKQRQVLDKHQNILRLAPEFAQALVQVMDAAKAYVKQWQVMEKPQTIMNLKQTPCLTVNDVCN